MQNRPPSLRSKIADCLGSLQGGLKEREVAVCNVSELIEHLIREKTDRLAHENRLLEAAKWDADEALASKKRHLAIASHDLRQPLHALGLFNHALSRTVDDPKALALIKRQGHSIASLTKMFDELLHVAKLDAGIVKRALVTIRLRELIDRAGAEFSERADDQGLKFNSLCADCAVTTDPALLETMLRNLLSNAFKFTKTGGVLLAGRRRGQNAIIEVYDTGLGIASDKIASIFQEFERSPQQATGHNEGLGLGLSIVSRNAALIGAKISVVSNIGRGSRFGIELPAATAHDAADVGERPAAPTPSISGISILVLGDNPSACDALVGVLSGGGAVVSVFTAIGDAQSALSSGFEPDVAIIDYDLGGTATGVDIANVWRDQNHPIKVMILTGWTDAPTLAKLTSSEIDWLSKPATANDIMCVIARLVKTRACKSELPGA